MEFGELANAIILQAIKDYEKDYAELKRIVGKEDTELRQKYLRHSMDKIDSFFKGDWCASLSHDGVARSWEKKKAEIRERIGRIEE
jgi:hypothetical protein